MALGLFGPVILPLLLSIKAKVYPLRHREVGFRILLYGFFHVLSQIGNAITAPVALGAILF